MELNFEQVVPAPIETVFAFYRDPSHLPRLLHRWPRFRLLHSDGPVRLGGLIWVEERFCGIPVALGFRHHVFDPPQRLGGELFHGPFARFSHVHEFARVPGGTRVRDHLDIRVPRHFGGEWSMRQFIAPLLRQAFALRQAALRELAESGELAAQ